METILQTVKEVKNAVVVKKDGYGIWTGDADRKFQLETDIEHDVAQDTRDLPDPEYILNHDLDGALYGKRIRQLHMNRDVSTAPLRVVRTMEGDGQAWMKEEDAD